MLAKGVFVPPVGKHLIAAVARGGTPIELRRHIVYPALFEPLTNIGIEIIVSRLPYARG